MLTICGRGSPENPRPPARPPSPPSSSSFGGRTRYRRDPSQQGGRLPGMEHSRRSQSRGGAEAACSPSRRQDGGGEGEAGRAAGGEAGPRGCGAESPPRDPGGGGGTAQSPPPPRARGPPNTHTRLPAGTPHRSPRSGERLT